MSIEVAHLCLIASEECNEIGKALSKIGRFGPHNFNPADGSINHQKLTAEINDLLAVLELLEERGVPTAGTYPDRFSIEAKKQKVLNHMEISRENGCLY